MTQDDQPVPPSDENQDISATDESSGQKRNWFRAWGMPTLILLIFGSALIWVRLFFNPLQGQAFVNLLTVVFGGLLVIFLAVWVTFFSYYSRKFVAGVMLPLVAISAVWAGSIRNVEFDGDMNASFIYRWEAPAQLQTAPVETEAAPDLVENYLISETDWPAYRGLHRDGIITGPPLSADWDTNPPPMLWQTNVGGGYASMSVVGDLLVTIEQREQSEAIVCYNSQTGELKWIHEYPSRFYEAMGGLGPRTTPTIHNGRVYSCGASGVITCLNLRDGQSIWTRELLKELNIPNITWGLSSSPLVVGSMLIVNPGGATGNGLMALDMETGETIWQGKGLDQYTEEQNVNMAGYSSPMLMTLHGQELLIIFDGIGLSAHDPSSGEQIWLYEHQNDAGVNVAQPVLLEDGQHIFISASYAMGSALVKVSYQPQADDSGEIPKLKSEEWTVEKVWHDPKILRSKFSNVVYHDGYIYGLDEGIMMCIEPLTGDKQWKAGRFGHGQFIKTGDHFLVLAEDGELHLVSVRPDKFESLTSYPALPETTRVWNPFSLSNGTVYVRDHRTMAAYNLE